MCGYHHPSGNEKRGIKNGSDSVRVSMSIGGGYEKANGEAIPCHIGLPKTIYIQGVHIHDGGLPSTRISPSQICCCFNLTK
jgi:hypothetical protein